MGDFSPDAMRPWKLTTSHSAHKTAFCRATAFRDRLTSQGPSPSTYESFITEPRKTAWIYLTLIGPNCLPHDWAILTSPTVQWLSKAPTFLLSASSVHSPRLLRP